MPFSNSSSLRLETNSLGLLSSLILSTGHLHPRDLEPGRKAVPSELADRTEHSSHWTQVTAGKPSCQREDLKRACNPDVITGLSLAYPRSLSISLRTRFITLFRLFTNRTCGLVRWLVSKSTCHPAYCPGSNPHGGMRGLTPSGCPLMSRLVPQYLNAHTYTHARFKTRN